MRPVIWSLLIILITFSGCASYSDDYVYASIRYTPKTPVPQEILDFYKGTWTTSWDARRPISATIIFQKWESNRVTLNYSNGINPSAYIWVPYSGQHIGVLDSNGDLHIRLGNWATVILHPSYDGNRIDATYIPTANQARGTTSGIFTRSQ